MHDDTYCKKIQINLKLFYVYGHLLQEDDSNIPFCLQGEEKRLKFHFCRDRSRCATVLTDTFFCDF